MDTWLSFFGQISEVQLAESQDTLARLFSLQINEPHVSAIQADLKQKSLEEINRAVDYASILNDEWPSFSSLCKAYLHWCALIIPESPESCFNSYAKVFLSLQQVFSHSNGSCFNLVIRNTTRTVFSLFANQGKMHAEWIAAGILKLFNSVRSEREIPAFAVSKKINVLFYANMISRLYFKSQQFVSAGNVFKNMYSLELSLSSFPLSEQVEYSYWLGRYYLYTCDAPNAFTHLRWAWQRSLPEHPQHKLILEWLVIPSIIVGKFPCSHMIGMLNPDAQEAVTTLMEVIKTGQHSDYSHVTLKNTWVQKRHLRPVIEKYLPLLMYRKGLHRLIKLSKSERLSLDLCRSAFHLSPAADPHSVLAEDICVRLISNGMLKAKILPRSQILALKPVGSIPLLNEYNDLEYSEQDKWMLI